MSKITIMIVDDHTLIRETWSYLLGRNEDLEVIAELGDGQRAIEIARDKRPNIVLLDINMPEMNGLEFLEALRKEANHAETPVIMLTSEAAEDVLNKAKEFGIKGWILKPAQPNSVKSLLEKFCA